MSYLSFIPCLSHTQMTTKLLNPCFTRSLSTLTSVNPSSPKVDPTSKILNYFRKSAIKAPDPEVVDVDRLPNPSTPWLMLSPERQCDKEVWDRFYSPAENRVVRINREESLGVPSTAKCVASTRGWLGFVDRQGSCPIFLTNPYKCNDINVVSLPSLSTLPRFSEVDPMEREANYWWCDFDDDWEWDHADPKKIAELPLLSRFTLSHPDPCSPDCVVAANEKHPEGDRNISYFPIGRKMNNDTQDFKWFEPGMYALDVGQDIMNWQIVFSRTNNLFYALLYDYGSNGRINSLSIHNESIEISQHYFKDLDPVWRDCRPEFLESLDGPKPVKFIRTIGPYDQYLVALENGDLLVVFRYYFTDNRKKLPTNTTLHFDVCRIDFQNNRLQHLESLNGQSMFIGRHNHSFCGEFSGTLPDCIYFSIRKGSHYDVGIFNMKDNIITPCYPFGDEEELNSMSLFKDDPFWVAPKA